MVAINDIEHIRVAEAGSGLMAVEVTIAGKRVWGWLERRTQPQKRLETGNR